jgi:hypothetical protein
LEIDYYNALLPILLSGMGCNPIHTSELLFLISLILRYVPTRFSKHGDRNPHGKDFTLTGGSFLTKVL